MQKLVNAVKDTQKDADYWSLLFIDERQEEIAFRLGIQRPYERSQDCGVLITVMKNGGVGYASTQDLSPSALKSAYNLAFDWANKCSQFSLLKDVDISLSNYKGSYKSEVKKKFKDVPLANKCELLYTTQKEMQKENHVVDASSSLWSITTNSTFYNSLGAEINQEIHRIIPSLSVTAYKNGISSTRTLGGMRAYCLQGGYEALKDLNLVKHAQDIVKDAIDLVHAPNCPNENMDVLIDPDQMMLQIHESIGHPIELDRILGDERNYAGTTFVSLDMFGSYQYGSPLLNVTFDPTIKSQFASYGFDDEGTKANKEFIIKDGILLKPLGGIVSQARAKISGVACARSSSWNRPPIDRMANLNVEAGRNTFEEMVSSIKRGIYIKSNSSWSIDDSRNKFQFGCEWGRLIENGKLKNVVRTPNYRGISANFWRNLRMVGNEDTRMIFGTPYCGKGEPNQCIRVGHASPICLFENVEVFGGE